MSSIIRINNQSMPHPSVFKVDVYDLDSDATTRNAKGQLVRDRVAVKRRLIIEWPPLSMTETSIILKAIENEFFQVTYPDPMEGQIITKTFYVGGRQMPLFKVKGDEYIWEGLKMNFIER